MEYTPRSVVLELLLRYARHLPDDEFFRDGNQYLKPFVKLGVLSQVPNVPDDNHDVEICCNVPDCTFFCQSVVNYEAHYNAQHRYTCGECKKTLPNAHLLDLHLSETHDSYFAALVQAGKGPMYACFLEECKYRSTDVVERRDHCIREHKFPHNFRFDKQSLSHRLIAKSPELDTKIGEKETVVPEAVTPPRCRKNFVFGHSRQRTFKATQPKCDILDRMVVDLLESLPKEQ
ncbi:protein lethal(2)k10201 [Anopheles aquasalis]|uniref:protein lethal(2)k10201 n=1 Tax=Anopheles aquasalis TaxID=42839 RepID=UPI00215AE1EA|nr:protein lethal(2)k10201 [Anopheles aquasalis]